MKDWWGQGMLIQEVLGHMGKVNQAQGGDEETYGRRIHPGKEGRGLGDGSIYWPRTEVMSSRWPTSAIDRANEEIV